MARIFDSRNIILSLKDYLEPLLSDEGYDFTFVSDWGSSGSIVLPDEYIPGKNQIKLPAGRFTLISRNPGDWIELGGSSKEALFFFNFFVYMVSEGQMLDLLDFLHTTLESGIKGALGANRIDIYDFSDCGYPSSFAPIIYNMEIEEVRHRPIINIGIPNIAEKYAGSITFLGRIIISR